VDLKLYRGGVADAVIDTLRLAACVVGTRLKLIANV